MRIRTRWMAPLLALTLMGCWGVGGGTIPDDDGSSGGQNQKSDAAPGDTPDADPSADLGVTDDAALPGEEDMALPGEEDMAAPGEEDMAPWQRPDMARPRPDMARPQPDMARPQPDMARPQPDMAKPQPDMAKPQPDMTPPPVDDGSTDPFGVDRLYPTKRGGREWFLPATANKSDSEWQPNTTVTKVSDGVFQVSGAPRMMVVSPSGKAWWRNVEMTAYLKQTGTVNFYADQVPHWELFVRGEEHTNDNIAPSRINGGVSAPAGTPTWPGYPFSGYSTVNHSCLASCYHGHMYPNGKVLFEKEITHTQGYVYGLAQKNVSNFQDAMNRWFGYKLVVRNKDNDKHVHMEIWVDKDATGNWVKVSEADDVGSWTSSNSNMNGCTSSPFNYSTNQIVTWAGPWASFRVDNMTYQFKNLSVREIDPLP